MINFYVKEYNITQKNETLVLLMESRNLFKRVKNSLCTYSSDHGSGNSSTDDQMMDESVIAGHTSRHAVIEHDFI